MPISDRCAMMVTIPSGAIDTKTRGSLTVPCGILSAPVVNSAAMPRRDSTGAASTRPRGDPHAAEHRAAGHILDPRR